MQPTGPTQPPAQEPPQYPPYQSPPPPGYYAQAPVAPGAPPRPPSHAARNVAIIVVVLVVVVAIVVLAEYRSSTLLITVTSNHITNSVTYIVTLDGRQVDSGTLAPGQSVQDSEPLIWWGDSCQAHSVVATSTGGGLGPETDSATGIVCSGVPASADLSI